MRVLVVESVIGDSNTEMLDLIVAGHDVVRCQPLADYVRPCAGIAGMITCPLSTRVDVVVDVRTPGAAAPQPRELGAQCAAMCGVPIVVLPATG